MWYSELQRDFNYQYNSTHYSESASDKSINTYYKNLTDINADVRVPTDITDNGKKWIYLFDQRCDTTGDNVVVEDEISKNNVFFDSNNFAGIYKDESGHYYAVEMQYRNPDTTVDPTKDSSRAYLTFINTRIGIVNFKATFDWKVGDWQKNHSKSKVMLKITGSIRELGHDTPDTPVNSFTKEVEVGDETSVTEYYFTNLPKYDNKGRVIFYKLEEVLINGQERRYDAEHDEYYFYLKDSESDLEKEVNRCVVTVEENDYKAGTDSLSNDLVSYVITNRFSDEVADYTIKKKWADNHNVYATRPDIYIRMHRIVIGDQTHTDETVDYRWTPNDGDSTHTRYHDYWTFHFGNLEKYDPNGYEYLYFVEELPITGKNRFEAQSITGNYLTTYSQNVPKSTPDIADRNKYATEREQRLWKESGIDQTKYAFNNGTITNRLYGEVKINGSKLWEKIDNRFVNEKQYYPIADVYLYRKENGVKYKDNTVNGKKIQDTKKGEMISETQIFYGNSKFHFNSILEELDNDNTQYYYLIKNDNLILPKYDEYGALIKYTLDEKAINGYTFKIGDQEIVNTYDGGDPIKIIVTKHWENMNPESEYPTIKFTLHQRFKVKDEQESNSEPETIEWTYTKLLTKDVMDENNNWVCTFGGKTGENFRKYAPNGTEFEYSVTEEMINYKGESKLFTTSGEEGLGFTYTETFDNAQEFNDGFIEKNADVTNTYNPKEDTFNGQIIVTKDWHYNDSDNSSNRTEYEKAKNYKFTVSRKTKKIAKSNVLSVDTTCVKGASLPSVIWDEGVHAVEEIPMTAYDVNDETIDVPTASPDKISYYKAVYYFNIIQSNNDHQYDDHLESYIRIDADTKQVEIDGLAIYGQDAVQYEYYVTEENDNGKMNAYSYSPIPGKLITEQGEEPNKFYRADFTLTNTLKVFDIVAEKQFYKKFFDATFDEHEVENTQIVKIEGSDYSQYFDSNYVDQLRFDLYRSTESGFETSDQALYKRGLALESGTYKLTIKDIPRYDPYGNAYYYLLVERDNTKGDSVEKNDPDEINAPEVKGGSIDVKVENIFPTKRIRVDKFWDDSDNIDGMRPTQLDYTITETVPGLDTPISINNTLSDSDNWCMYVELPMYYYNGSRRTDGLRYKIDEDLESYNDNIYNFTPLEAGYTLYQSGYYFEGGSPSDPDGYFVGGSGPTGTGGGMWEEEEEDLAFNDIPLDENAAQPFAKQGLEAADFKVLDESGDNDPDVGHQEDEFFDDDDPPPISNDDGVLILNDNGELEGLYLKNTKSRYEGRIIVSKKWANDDDLIWRVRPNYEYVMLQRRLLGTSDDWEQAKSIYGSTLRPIKIYSSGSKNYFYDIPLGTVTNDSSPQSNGTYTPYEYRVVECDSNGNIYENENAVNFNYKWNSYIGKSNKPDNEIIENDDKYKIRSSIFEPDIGTTHAELKSFIKNEYRPITHTMQKTWIDFNDY